jgi:hypothetical protein
MNEEDEIISMRRLRSTRTSSMSDEASLGLRLVEELSETACSPRPRKKIRRGIVWQVAYGVRPTPEELAVRGGAPSATSPVYPQSSRHSEHVMVGSSAITPYTH